MDKGIDHESLSTMLGFQKIKNLRNQWFLSESLACFLISLNPPILYYWIYTYLKKQDSPLLWLVLPIWIFSLLPILWIRNPWKIKLKSTSEYLDQNFPLIEESSGLFIQKEEEFNSPSILRKWQMERIQTPLQSIPNFPKKFLRFLLSSFVASCLFLGLGYGFFRNLPQLQTTLKSEPLYKIRKVEKKISNTPSIKQLSIDIIPPKYLHVATSTQHKGDLLFPSGSKILWRVETYLNPHQVSLVFNGTEKHSLSPGKDPYNSTFEGSIQLQKSGFYQISLDGKLSDFYSLQAVLDAPPTVEIIKPPSSLAIGNGSTPTLILNVKAEDDYGVKTIVLRATVVKGSGESVKFKEYSESVTQLKSISPMQGIKNGIKKYKGQVFLSARKFDMTSGDELYYYALAIDTYLQEGKSSVFYLKIPDSSRVKEVEAKSGVNPLKPEFFRSQRQIIMDSERLLSLGKKTNKTHFKEQSNGIGFDQRILRQRYGKFLGEESEGEISKDIDLKNLNSTSVQDFGNASKILDIYTDKHDNAEDASFLAPEQKRELKAILAAMWLAELNLRLGNPAKALPYEYQALRLLKDFQQKSRVFVAKASHRPNRFAMEKRLSGDLNTVIRPELFQSVSEQNPESRVWIDLIHVLELIKSGNSLSYLDHVTLNQASQNLQRYAIQDPSKYLKAYHLLKAISAVPMNLKIESLESTIVTLLRRESIPKAILTGSGESLSKEYFKRLERANESENSVNK